MRITTSCVSLLLVGLVGCAHLPDADQDIDRALQGADSHGRIDRLRHHYEEITGVPFSEGNSVHLLRDGSSTYAAMKAAIAGATRYIYMESYWFDESVGRGFAELLVNASRRGVAVYLIYDAWGSVDTPAAMFDGLRAAGIHVLEFSPIDPAAVVEDLVDRRDHRKVMVVDGKIAVTGGVNISGVYLRRRVPPGALADGEPWRDTDIRIEGPAVADLEECFKQVWKEQKGPPLDDHAAPVPGAKGDFLLQVITNTPAVHDHAIYRSLLVSITLARKSVHLTTGFFVPTPDLVRALRRAARRGVDVAVLVPASSTSNLAIEAGRSHYEDLLESGVHIYEFQGRVLHAKTAVIDGDWSSVGSSNLDWRSVVLNNEINTVILSRTFGQEMESLFRDDTAQSKPIQLSDWERRGFMERFREQRARLIEAFL
ncbi:phospholipase D-like domain-containing protein [Nevskia soli]|uniref:phospholipase D-like domain-containing protein n=1 Tax=Nevskia soli TaxID=418856 RepID=UPI0004A7100A|nr:phospholipase D-like domain-containing protein [Nevskia soli]